VKTFPLFLSACSPFDGPSGAVGRTSSSSPPTAYAWPVVHGPTRSTNAPPAKLARAPANPSPLTSDSSGTRILLGSLRTKPPPGRTQPATIHPTPHPGRFLLHRPVDRRTRSTRRNREDERPPLTSSTLSAPRTLCTGWLSCRRGHAGGTRARCLYPDAQSKAILEPDPSARAWSQFPDGKAKDQGVRVGRRIRPRQFSRPCRASRADGLRRHTDPRSPFSCRWSIPGDYQLQRTPPAFRGRPPCSRTGPFRAAVSAAFCAAERETSFPGPPASPAP